MSQDDRGLFEDIGADPSTGLEPSSLDAGDEIAFNPPGNEPPEVRTVERAEETLIGPEVRLEGGDILLPSDLNEPSDTPRAAPLTDGGAPSGLRSVGFERQEPTGRFAPTDTRPDGSVPPDRAPDGRFVSPEREPIEDIGRRSDDGLFDLF